MRGGEQRPRPLVAAQLDAGVQEPPGRGQELARPPRSCTRSVSAALQTPGRWVLALTTMAAAMSRSAAASTYTWQLPSPSIT